MKIIAKICSVIFILCSVVLFAQSSNKVREVLKDGTVVINSTLLAKNVSGYAGATPIKLFVKNGVVSKIEFLENYETPGYFMELEHDNVLTKQWVGKKLKDAASVKVDAVSGSTISSDAIIENVRRAIKYEIKKSE